MGLALAALILSACTDKWDDHYNDSALAGTNAGTIWQAMEKNDQLSNFCRVAQSCGYDKILKSTQAFSVFAPTNANFSSTQADSVISLYQSEVAAGTRLSENRAVKEFLQNHIARYTYSVASTTSDSIVMMNGKYMVLTNTTFGNMPLASSNQLYENGVLFTLGEPAKFYNNIFEFLDTEKQKKGGYGMDSVAAFLYSPRYYRYYLNEAQSVQGEIDPNTGRMVYLDSVMVKENLLFYGQGLGQLHSEDSTYWMVAPDNTQWDKLVKEYEKYFVYNEKVKLYDSLRWSEPRLAILRGSVFSLSRNTALKNYLESGTAIDSMVSTNAVGYNQRRRYYGSDTLHYYQYGTRLKPQDPFATGGVFNGADQILCSNGRLLKSTNWNIDKHQTFMQDIIVEGEDAQVIVNPEVTKRTTSVGTVPATCTELYNRVSGNKYLEIAPKDASIHNPDFAIMIPNVLSNVKYDIYMVLVPDTTKSIDPPTDPTIEMRKPTNLQISRLYLDEKGDGLLYDSIKNPLDKTYTDAAHFMGNFDGANGRGYGIGTDIDTICLGKGVVFPSCSYNLEVPEVQIRILSNVLTFPPFIDQYSRTLRIDCIIFKPQEMVPGE